MLPHPTRGARCELSVSHMLSRCSTYELTPATKTTVHGILRVWNITFLPFQIVPEKSPFIFKSQGSLWEWCYRNLTDIQAHFDYVELYYFLLHRYTKLCLSQNELLVLYLEVDSLFCLVQYPTQPVPVSETVRVDNRSPTQEDTRKTTDRCP